MKRLPLLLLPLTLLLLLIFWPRAGITNSGQASVEWISAEQAGISEQFTRAYEPTELTFPEDLGPHSDYQTEWWYYTGNLETEAGRAFGYQLTFFRRALATPESSASQTAADTSDWRTNQIYFAHFTLSDIANQKFYPHERFSRASAKLSGAQAVPYRVWLEDWSAEEIQPGQVHLVADAGDVALDLMLNETLPPVLQGDRGYSIKGPEPGNASSYYSIVQQQTAGTVSMGDRTYTVSGLTWKDHEYSTSALSPGTVGWDWFSLQLDNGGALMLYGLRQEDGTIADISSGTYVNPQGQVQHLSLADWQINVLDTWHSPISQADYPAQWHIAVPQLGLALDGQSLIPNQELNISTTYWEGAVAFDGVLDNQPIAAKGYVEMTGYADSLDSLL
ncbi:MAG: hypothetical protein F6J97_16125 [Leptolyngbya sp. SIO4C1]|nr:hypothetical protein [Leptolyngbya sp. SIO4C1]